MGVKGSWRAPSCCLCPDFKSVKLVNKQGRELRLLCISSAQEAGQTEWSTFPVHEVNVSDAREIKVIRQVEVFVQIVHIRWEKVTGAAS